MNVSLTDNARKVLDQAQLEARQLNQEFVGTEHVLLSLLHVSGTQAARILRQQHVDRDALRSQLLSVMPFSDITPVVTGNLPLSPKVQRVLNSALVMSRSLREPKLSTRVLLLALMDEEGTPFVKALRDTGVDVEQLLRGLSEKPADSEA
jgi:ATP-dependent Clp protease ATP-binding subunit ClpC